METTPVNIRVSTDDKQDGQSMQSQRPKEGMYENFIVSTNRDYRNQIISLQQKLSEVEKEKDDFEADNEKIETSQRYMRGILKNYYEIDQYNTRTLYKVNGLLEKTKRSVLMSRFITAIVVCCACASYFLDQWALIMSAAFGTTFILTKILENNLAVPTRELEDFIDASNSEIQTIKKTNELLPDLFDNL